MKKGDQVGLVCPAGFMTLEKVQTCIQTLEEWGYRVKVEKAWERGLLPTWLRG